LAKPNTAVPTGRREALPRGAITVAGGHVGSRVLLLLASMAGAAVLVLTWAIALDIVKSEHTERDFAAQSRAMQAARQGRDAVPRALEPADRALALLQARAAALARYARPEAEGIEQSLIALARRGQDGIRAMAVTDAAGAVTWQTQPGALGPWLGNAEFFMAHSFGRMSPVLGRFSGPAGGGMMTLSYPLLATNGAFVGVAVAVLEPSRLAQALPAMVAPGDAQVLLFHSDGALLARGRSASQGQAALRLDPALLPEAGSGGERSLVRREGSEGRATAHGSALVSGLDLVVLASIEEAAGGLSLTRIAIAIVIYGLAGGLSCLVALGLLWLFGRVLRAAEGPVQMIDLQAVPVPEPEPAPAAQALQRNEVVPPMRSPPPPAPPPAPLPLPILPPPILPSTPAAGMIEALPTVAYAARITHGAEQAVRITAVNSTLRQLTGWEAAVFQDVARWQRTIDWGSYPSGPPLLERLGQAAPEGDAVPEAQVEYRLRRPDGTWMWLRETAKVLARHPGHVDVLGCLADVTRERELAAQADSASRVAARGAMAAGLAHELNQPLAVMSLAAENALEALEEGAAGIPEALTRLRRIATQAERAKVIAAQLRSFARLEAAVLEPVSLHAATRAALSLTNATLQEHGVEVALRLDPALPAVRGQPVLVEQVIVNLILNAKDAIASRAEGPRRLIIIGEPGMEAHEVRLLVSDTGGGIPAEAIERVFDPFFTTKSSTKGTGLGLPLCRSIMLRFGGGIALTNLPSGLGAVAVLTFQRARNPNAEALQDQPLSQGV
jgi:signal transduction histidine kinase